MLPGMSQAQGAVWTLASGWHRAQLHTCSLMTPPLPCGLSLCGQWPAMTAWPLTEGKREGLPTGISFSLYQNPPQLSVRRQATTAAPSPRGRHAQGLCSASTGTGDMCVCAVLAPQRPTVGVSLKHRSRPGVITLKGPRPGSGGISEKTRHVSA